MDVPKIISFKAAKEAIMTIVDILSVSLERLREVSASEAGVGALGPDSFTSIEIIHEITTVGIKVPSTKHCLYTMPENSKIFLQYLMN